MSHRCHYPQCDTPTQPKMLFCLGHWRMVPEPQQRAVWATYRATTGRDDRMRNVPYLTACAEAVEAVAAKSGMKPEDARRNVYRRIVLKLAEIEAMHSPPSQGGSAAAQQNGGE